MGKRARVIAFYLPQYHPIPENDEWWGRGFTEWTNVARAKPMFRGHYQPRVPADLGFYDLRVPETRQAQAEMAREHGIEGFGYWHYWFAGRRLLDLPFNEVLKSGEPDFPFCLAWANETWSGIWHGAPDRILIEQTYPGPEDHAAHFQAVLPAFEDVRYLTVEGKPLFYVYHPKRIPEVRRFTDLWRELAVKAGLRGLYLVGQGWPDWDPVGAGFDAGVDTSIPPRKGWEPWYRPLARLEWEWRKRTGLPSVYSYAKWCEKLVLDQFAGPDPSRRHPALIPDWDNTPRSGANAVVLHGSTPELFRRQVRVALELAAAQPPARQLVFLKSWNEWAESNYVEPDLRFGRGYLGVLREEFEAGG